MYYSDSRNGMQSMCTAEQYNSVYKEIEGMDNETAYIYLKEKLEDSSVDVTTIIASYPYRIVLDEVEQCVTYEEYLERVQKDAKKFSSIAIFAKTDSFGRKNAEITAREFGKLEGNTLSCGPSRGVNLLTDFSSTDIIAVFMVFVAVASLVMKEKENSI